MFTWSGKRENDEDNIILAFCIICKFVKGMNILQMNKNYLLSGLQPTWNITQRLR